MQLHISPGDVAMLPHSLAFTKSMIAFYGKIAEAQIVATLGMIECMRRFGPFATVVTPPAEQRIAPAEPANLISEPPRASRRAKG
ncbi:MAG: hypothetical protein ACO38S_07595 [Gemmobacter sp.]